MSPLLPLRPNLEHLKEQAKELLGSYRSGHPQAYASFQTHLPRLSRLPAGALPSADVSLHDAQYVLAREYGFANWAALRAAVAQSTSAAGLPPAGVLSPDEIASFAELGHLRVRGAFAREAALAIRGFMWSELKRMHGFDPADPSSWSLEGWTPSPRPSSWTRLQLNRTKDHGIYQAISSPRLLGAYEQLAGPGKAAAKQSWGAFPVRFPEPGDHPWDLPSTGWHVVPHLRVITFYLDVGARGGPSLLVEGSHRLVASWHEQLGPDQRRRKPSVLDGRFARSHPWFAELAGKAPSQGDRIRRSMEETTVVHGVAVRVVALTGEPGDAVFCYPGAYQNASSNRTDAPSFTRG
ncbi:MAG: hypothetical protein AB1505_02125 [Candidatus Latescibacterota bacterium]